jgi:hypothetical protein
LNGFRRFDAPTKEAGFDHRKLGPYLCKRREHRAADPRAFHGLMGDFFGLENDNALSPGFFTENLG